MRTAGTLYAGLDIGGTSVKLGVVGAAGQLLRRASAPTPIGDPSAMAALCARLVQENCPEAAGVGVACAGRVDRRTGEVTASNLSWVRAPFAALLKERLGHAPALDNDVQTALYGEWRAGACKGYTDVLYVALGTGIGGGMILRGKPYRGPDNMGGEIGHMVTHAQGDPCPCGRSGCFERYASAKALERMSGGMDARSVFARAQAGDPAMNELLNRYIGELCIGLSNLHALFHPQMTLIGGGLSYAGPFLLDAIRRGLNAPGVLPVDAPTPRVELAALAGDAGVIGAAMMAIDREWSEELALSGAKEKILEYDGGTSQ